MKELQDNQLDALITASLYRNVLKDAEAFLNLDVLGIKEDPHIKNKILSRSNNRRCTSWLSTLRIIAVACLIIMSVIFTACMCIPEVRESMWNAIVDWYEDHIHVHFTYHNIDAENNNEEKSFTDTHQEPPNSIEKRAVAIYLPEGYYAEDNEISLLYTDTFYYDADGNMAFRLMQTVLGETNENDLMVDNENDPITTVYINGHEGLLVEYPDVPGLYYLVWQDEDYQYSLYGSFNSVAELMKIAKGIKTV